MYNETQSIMLLQKALPDVVVKAWTQYNDIYLVRVEYPSESEKEWDPFFSIDPVTGEVNDFSVITDGDISEISSLKWTDV